MKNPFLLTMNIEKSRDGKTFEIVESVELGTFRNEEEAREVLETILDEAGLEEEK